MLRSVVLAVVVGFGLPAAAQVEPVPVEAAPAADIVDGAATPEPQERREKTKRRKKKRRGDPWDRALRFRPAKGVRLDMPIEGTVWSGHLGGWGLQPDAGAALGAEIGVEPRLELKRVGIDARTDLRYAHQQAFDARLDQHRADVDGEIGWRITDTTRLAVGADFTWLQRPGWSDLYQPRLDARGEPIGGWHPTDRFGWTRLGGEAALSHTLRPRLRLTLDADIDDTVYVRDPAFDPVLRPSHLVPGDRRRGALGARVAFRTADKIWRGTVGAAFARTDWRFRFARDAGTGATHAGLGGEPANPLQSFDRFRLRQRTSAWIKPLDARVSLSTGYTLTDDRFWGYYSSHALDAELGVRVRPFRRFKVELAAGIDRRWYGDNGYAETAAHPPLDDGDTRRSKSRTHLEGRAEYRFWHRRLTAFVDARYVDRETSFPDYAPFEFPASAPYAIDWDADTWRMRAGVSIEVGP